MLSYIDLSGQQFAAIPDLLDVLSLTFINLSNNRIENTTVENSMRNDNLILDLRENPITYFGNIKEVKFDVILDSHIECCLNGAQCINGTYENLCNSNIGVANHAISLTLTFIMILTNVFGV